MNIYTPDLAIVVTTYKRQELLKKLLDSVAALKMQPTDVIVVDNESSEETKKLLEAYALPTHYIPMDDNSGGAGGFSRGIEEAYCLGHEWVWVMDDDVAVLPDAIEKLSKWTKQTEDGLASGKSLSEVATVYQGLRKNYDGSFFYWQYRFLNKLAIPNPISPSKFKPGETSRPMNTACFEGSLFHRSVIKKIGLPDARFFIYWDDTVFGYLASKQTKMLLVTDYVLERTRVLENVRIGSVRKLNATSDMTRYYIMRNRGHIAHYLRLHGDYHSLIFTFGTALTFAKEVIRLFITKSFKTGLPRLTLGMRDGKKIRKDKSWQPYSEVKPLDSRDTKNPS